MNNLVSTLNSLCDQHEFHTGWYLKNLKTGESADRNGDVIVPSASTRKIAILMTALKEVNGGKLRLGQPVTIESRYQDNTSGCFQHLEPGFTITLKDALVMMIIVSDNTCTGTVADIVGLDAVNALSQSIGMRGTAHRFGTPPKNLERDHPLEANNTTTPTDVGVLLDAILSGSRDASAAAKLGCTPELCNLAIDILSKQNLKTRLPYMLPAGAKVAHKTGTGARNFNDAGIVFQGDESLFILSAYTEHVPVETKDGIPGHTAANLLIASMAREAYAATSRTDGTPTKRGV